MIEPFIVSALLILVMGLALLTGFCIYGYRSLKSQLDQLVKDNTKAALVPEKGTETAQQLGNLRSHIDGPSRHRIFQFDADTTPPPMPAQTPAPPPPMPSAPASAPAGPDRRGQVMRLHRSGESIPAIASALGISQDEVKLMVKLQDLLPESAGEKNSLNFSNLGRNQR